MIRRYSTYMQLLVLFIVVIMIMICKRISLLEKLVVSDISRYRLQTDESFNISEYDNRTFSVRKINVYPVTISAPYIVNNPNLCRSSKNVTILVVVHTAPVHQWRRNEMRTTWLNTSYYYPERIVVIFLLGTTGNNTLQQDILHENSLYGDIVQGNFVDSYRNLTNKGVMGLRWISENCLNAEVVMKIDDDVFVNLFLFFNKYATIRKKERLIFCNKINKNTVIIERNIDSKWYVHKDELKEFEMFPFEYCSGFAVFISTDLVPALFNAAVVTPFFWIDDVYLFGMLPSRVSGVNFKKFSYHRTFIPRKGLECFRRFGAACHYIAVSLRPDEGVQSLWREVINHRINDRI